MKRKYTKRESKFEPFKNGLFNLKPDKEYNYLLGYHCYERNLSSSVIIPDVKFSRRINHLPAE